MRVLVAAPAWVGDMVMAHCLVPPLVERGDEVHFLAPVGTAPLAARMPGVQAVHAIRTRHGRLDLAERWAVGRRLRRHRFDQAIVLPNSLKSALAPFFAGIARRTGFLGEQRYGLLNDIRRLDRARLPRMVERLAALAQAAPARPRLAADRAETERLLEQHRLADGRSVVALCPGAEYGPAKRWPTVHFATLARRLGDAGCAVWVLGSGADAEAGAMLAESGARDLTGRTTLGEAVDLLSAAAAAVANDSGLMHVAAALDVPVAAVYGASSADFTPPLSPCAAILARELPCRPCFARTCRYGHYDCLRGIEPEAVFDAVMAFGLGAAHRCQASARQPPSGP